MLNLDFETKRRLKITKNIGNELENIVVGIILGGSMGFGQNFSIKKTSDIDTVVICERKNINNLLNTLYFKNQVDQEVIDLFKEKKIDLFWVTKNIEGIEVNFFVYDKKSYEDFCLLKGNLKGYLHFKPEEIQTAYGFDGNEIIFNRNVAPFRKGFLYEKPTLANGKYWGGVPRQDFFYSGYIIYEQDNFLSNLEKLVWKKTIIKLKEEAGTNFDLSKYNILNTHYTYHKEPERLSKTVVTNIKKRTQKELNLKK